jgi:modulator of FtsH protease
MAAFHPLLWHDYFVAALGASAALTGLVFVAMSINLQEILRYPRLPGRAAGTLGVLLSILLVSCFVLAPGQSLVVLGVEVLATGVAVTGQAAWVSTIHRAVGDPRTWTLTPLISLTIPGLTLAAGGVSLIAGGGGGLYWLLAATVLAFAAAAFNAWVLLVEIVR